MPHHAVLAPGLPDVRGLGAYRLTIDPLDQLLNSSNTSMPSASASCSTPLILAACGSARSISRERHAGQAGRRGEILSGQPAGLSLTFEVGGYDLTEGTAAHGRQWRCRDRVVDRL